MVWAICLSLALPTTLPLPANAAEQAIGTIEDLQGPATVVRKGKKTGETAVVGLPIYQGDAVQTYRGGQLRLKFIDESRVSVASDSRLVIDKYVYSPDKKQRRGALSILWGKVKCVVQDVADYREKRFSVSTTTAVIGVRGTEFIIWSQGRSKSRIAVLKNAVDVAGKIKQAADLILEAGKWVDVLQGQAPGPPQDLTVEILQGLLDGFLPQDAVPPDLDKLQSGSGQSAASKAASEAASKTTETATNVAGSSAGQAGTAGSTAATVAAAAAAAASAAVTITSNAVKSAKEALNKPETPNQSSTTSDQSGKPATAQPGEVNQPEPSTAKTPGQPQTETPPATTDAPEKQPGNPPISTTAPPKQPPIQAPVVKLRFQPKFFTSDLHLKQSERGVRRVFAKFISQYGQMPDRFVDNGDGTVTDRATGLMWQKDFTPAQFFRFCHQPRSKSRRKPFGRSRRLAIADHRGTVFPVSLRRKRSEYSDCHAQAQHRIVDRRRGHGRQLLCLVLHNLVRTKRPD